MTRAACTSRLCNLVRRYRPGEEDASFRNRYREIVGEVGACLGLQEEDVDLLMRARECLEDWASPAPPEARQVLRQWLELYESGKSRLPTAILAAFLSRLPGVPRKTPEWASFILQIGERELVETLLARRFTRVSDLVLLAQDRPAEFYGSAALDVLVHRRKSVPRSVWTPLIRGERRPSGLLSGAEALLRSYLLDRRTDADRWLTTFLGECPQEIRESLLTTALDIPAVAVRVSRYLASNHGAEGRGKGARHSRPAEVVLRDWIAVCQRALQEDGSAAQTAIVALGFVTLSRVAHALASGKDASSAEMPCPSDLAEGAVLKALRRAQAIRPESSSTFVFVVRGDEVYRAVQRFLDDLPLSAVAQEETPERARRWERFVGRREVVQELVSALEDLRDDASLRDAVEVALFNAGVRVYGAPGERVLFDARYHEPLEPGIVPGDPVVVTRPGRKIGEEAEGIVVVKAKVRRGDAA